MANKIEKKQEMDEFLSSERWLFLCDVDNKVSVIESGFNLVSASIIVFLMLFVVAEVIGRYLFNRPIYGHYEIVVAAMVPLVFLGLSYTERVGGHIRMELLISRIPRGRFYYSLEILMLLCCLVVVGLFVFKGFEHTMFMWEIGHASELIRFPHWPFQLCVVIGCLLLCIRFLIEIFQKAAELKKWKAKRRLVDLGEMKEER